MLCIRGLCSIMMFVSLSHNSNVQLEENVNKQTTLQATTTMIGKDDDE